MEIIKDIGAYAGVAAFLGLAVMALLYFAQARDVRRLRENASFLVEAPEELEPAEAAAAEPATATQAKPATQVRDKAPAAAPRKPADAEAFRRAELARQAAERRERFERRRGSGRQRLARGGDGRFSSLPEPGALIVIVIGALLLVAGIAFGASKIIGGDEEPATAGRNGVVPSQTTVAVLNSTSSSGLAAEFAKPLKQQGYKVEPIGNTDFPFTTSSVMFEKRGEVAARQIARNLKISKVEPLIDQVRPEAGGAQVTVVLGEDKAGGG